MPVSLSFPVCHDDVSGLCSTSLDYRFDEGGRHCEVCGHSPLRHYHWLMRLVLNPIKQFGYTGPGRDALMVLRKEVLDGILLRRTKASRAADLSLPGRAITVRNELELDAFEADFYQALYTQSRLKFGACKSTAAVGLACTRKLAYRCCCHLAASTSSLALPLVAHCHCRHVRLSRHCAVQLRHDLRPHHSVSALHLRSPLPGVASMSSLIPCQSALLVLQTAYGIAYHTFFLHLLSL